MKTLKKNIDTIYFIILTFISFYLTILISMVGKNGVNIVMFGVELNSTQIAGIISAIRIIVLALVILCNRKYGLIVDSLMLVGTVMSIVMSLVMGVKDAVPGIAHFFASVFLVVILNAYELAVERNNKKLEELSAYDSLLMVRNRRSFCDVMDELIAKNDPFNLVMITIKNFVDVNNALGRDYGDRVLLKISHKMKNLCDENEIIGRIGGADFAIIIKGRMSPEKVKVRTAQYLAVIHENIKLDNVELVMDGKAAVAEYPQDAPGREELFKHLDATFACNRNKKDEDIFFFDQNVTTKVMEEMRIEERLVEAISRDLFHLVFQPQFMSENKHLRGFETLCRLEFADGTPIRPDKFIGVAERTNMIFRIDDWVLEHSIKRFKPVIDEKPGLIISVNISAKHFALSGYADMVKAIIDKYEFPAGNLEIEMTETAFAADVEKVISCLDRLKNMGIRIALDDFGTGYASLSYLSKLPVSTLKIDKVFVDRIGNSVEDDEFVQVIISMGHILKLDVVAEGVETMQQKDILKGWQCDIIQGFLWGKPLEFEQAVKVE